MNNEQHNMRASFLVILAMTGYFLLAHLASATTLSIDPDKGTYAPGDTFVVTLRASTDPDECINAVRVDLRYPKELVKASVVSKGESLLTLFTEEPRIDQASGAVTFEGGIPAGYCGRIQGDPGKTNVIGKVVFAVPTTAPENKEPIRLHFGDETQVLLNDGRGTVAPLRLLSAEFTRGSSVPTTKKNEWLDIVNSDEFPPELFSLSVERDQNSFQGKHFLIFSSTDKQSGIHHYEVMEDDPDHFGFVRGSREKALFVSATSPYLLKDQTLESRITVRVYDHAGNVQESIVPPKNKPGGPSLHGSENTRYVIFVISVLLLLAIGYILYHFVKRRAHDHHDEGGT